MADINLSWQLDERALLSGLARIQDRLDDIEGELGQVQRASDEAFGRSGRRTREFDRNIRRTQGSIGGTSKLMQRLGTASKVALGALAVGAGAAATRAIQLSKSYEQTRVSFTTFLGSAALAEQVLAELNQFSLATPFEPTQVQEAGKALLAFGVTVDELTPALRRIGDIAAGSGKDFNELAVIYGKARVAGTLYAEDINQLTEAGIDVLQSFGEQLEVTPDQVKKLASEGKISFANLEQAFKDLTGEGSNFFNLMAEQSQTLAGLLSTLQGSFDNLLRELGDELLPVLKPVVREIINFIDSLDPEAIVLFFRPIKEDLVPALTDLYNSFVDLASSLLGARSEAELGEIVFQRLSDAFNNIVTTLRIFSEVSSFVVTSIKNIADAVNESLGAFEFIVESNEFVANAFEKLNNIDFRLLFENFSTIQRYYLGLGFDAKEFADNTVSGIERQTIASEEYQDQLAQQLEFDRKLREEAEKKEAEEARIRLAEKQAAKEREAEAQRAAQAVAKLREENLKLLKGFAELSEQAKFELLSPTEQAILQFEEANQEIEKTKNEIIRLSELTGQPLPDDFAENITAALQYARQELEKEIRDIRGENVLIDKLAGIDEVEQQRIQQDNKERIEEIGRKAREAAEKAASELELRAGFSPLLQFVQSAFGLTGREAQQVESQAESAVQRLVQGLDLTTELQISKQDAIIKKIDERISKQQELYNKEAELAEQGFANNLDAEKANLEALNEERRKAAERKNEIERNAANRTLAIEAATQVSSLTSTAIELFKGQAKFGLPGILFAASALATVFALVARARAQAAQFAQPIELRGGGLFDGPNLLSHEKQRRSGRYHRIEGTDMAIERGEWIIGTKHSKEHGSFLEALNAGKYSGVNIQESLAMAQALHKSGRRIRQASDSESVKTMMRKASGYDELKKEMISVRESVEAVQAEVRKRPVIVPAGKSQVITDDGIKREVKIINV